MIILITLLLCIDADPLIDSPQSFICLTKLHKGSVNKATNWLNCKFKGRGDGPKVNFATQFIVYHYNLSITWLLLEHLC